MKVHIHQIPAEGLHLEGTESSRIILDFSEECIKSASDVRYAIDVGLSDGGLFATGKLEVDLELECVSCLQDFPFRLVVPDFAMQIELTGPETVDLTER